MQLDRDQIEEPEGDELDALLEAHNRDLESCFKKLGHIASPGKQVNMAKGTKTEPRREAYRSLPRFMANN